MLTRRLQFDQQGEATDLNVDMKEELCGFTSPGQNLYR